MKNILTALILFSSIAACFAQEKLEEQSRIASTVDSTHVQNVVLQQSFEVNVPIDSVWNAFTTSEGWKSWATAHAEVDLKVNGTIRTHYDANSKIDDEGGITLHIINYVPKRLLTLQAEITDNFPTFMKEDEKDLFNTILFEEVSPTKTRVVSYGIGYKLNDNYRALMKFFIRGNEETYLHLINYLETGEPTVNK